ncbi:MAG: hypothetical protein ACK452_09265 [Bacteroidota bacterium]
MDNEIGAAKENKSVKKCRNLGGILAFVLRSRLSIEFGIALANFLIFSLVLSFYQEKERMEKTKLF